MCFSRLTSSSTVVVDSSPLPCEFPIPEPMGMDLDFGKVNLEITFNGMQQLIPKVASLAECMNVPDGWFYDDEMNPLNIILCPKTCMKVQSDDMAGIDVQFGCETLIPE